METSAISMEIRRPSSIEIAQARSPNAKGRADPEVGPPFRRVLRDQADARVALGSTGMPGPIVVVKVTFFRYRPFDADGLARSTSSSAAR